jgi:hypothetical protein
MKDYDEFEWEEAMVKFLESGGHDRPRDLSLSELITTEEAEKFELSREVLVGEGDKPDASQTSLLRRIDDTTSPYLQPSFRADFVQRMHRDFGHLGFPGLMGVIKYRAWWPTIKKDVQIFLRHCPNCLVASRSNPNLERELPRHLVQQGLQPFERWSIDLIGRLPPTPNGNRWIITAIDHATGWPVAKAVPEASAHAIADFLHDEIFMRFGPPRELFSDQGPNLLA